VYHFGKRATYVLNDILPNLFIAKRLLFSSFITMLNALISMSVLVCATIPNEDAEGLSLDDNS